MPTLAPTKDDVMLATAPSSQPDWFRVESVDMLRGIALFNGRVIN